MEGSHTLEKFINGVARDIDDPETKLTVWKRLQLRDDSRSRGSAEARNRADLRIGALGSGSDYTAFLDHLGVASLNLGFGGEDGGGIYHSIYDDFYWYTHFADTDFVYGRALAQTAGTAVMRLADAELLPYDFDNFTDTIQPLHRRGAEAGEGQARPDHRAQQADRRRRVRGDHRSARSRRPRRRRRPCRRS